ncbi:MAG: hypothetical protein CMK09_17420 [Ponticaulis sp.]|nr:hypothetical protein [Ponticaulis sp.]|tara:strand:+ start:2188 stop:2856 length:669 start_codon:yes stop_codon:yes gene_type:complete
MQMIRAKSLIAGLAACMIVPAASSNVSDISDAIEADAFEVIRSERIQKSVGNGITQMDAVNLYEELKDTVAEQVGTTTGRAGPTRISPSANPCFLGCVNEDEPRYSDKSYAQFAAYIFLSDLSHDLHLIDPFSTNLLAAEALLKARKAALAEDDAKDWVRKTGCEETTVSFEDSAMEVLLLARRAGFSSTEERILELMGGEAGEGESLILSDIGIEDFSCEA